MSQQSISNTQFVEGNNTTSTLNSVDESEQNSHANSPGGNYLVTSSSANTEYPYVNPQYPSYNATTHHDFSSQDLPLHPRRGHGAVYTYSNTTHQSHTSSTSRQKKKSSIKHGERHLFSKRSNTTTTHSSTSYVPAPTPQTSQQNSYATYNKPSSASMTATTSTKSSHRNRSRHSGTRTNRAKEASDDRQSSCLTNVEVSHIGAWIEDDELDMMGVNGFSQEGL